MTPGEAEAALAAAGVEAPRREARLLAGLAGDDPAALAGLVARRANREPFSRIAGRREFWSIEFELGPAVLDPRPDSETVVEAALAARPEPALILDLGVGSGCLLAALLDECPGARGLGIDLSPDALAVAARNLRGRPAWLAAGDWAAAVSGAFDLVVSNPPYVESGAVAGLDPEVREHDPALALDGGADGLDAYRAILPDLARLLAPGGAGVLEIGMGQAEAVGALAEESGLAVGEVRPDLAGIGRAMVLRGPL